MEVINPHDRFFRETLAHPGAIRDFLQYYLPADVVALIEPGSAELMKDSFIDDDLRQHFADMLYKVTLRDKRNAYVYIMYEHKSYPDPNALLQVMRYMVRIWEYHLRRWRKLWPILPVVVYHGATRWGVEEQLRELFDDIPEAMQPYTPNFRYALIDLSHYDDAEIKGEIRLRVALLTLKYVFRPELRDHLPDIVALFRDVTAQESGLAALETLLRYLSVSTEWVSEEDLRRAVEQTFIESGGTTVPTIAERWIEEGLQRGLQQGLQQGLKQGESQGLRQGLLEGIEFALELRFGLDGLRLMPEIARIEDIAVLRVIREGIRQVEKPDELRRFYRSLD